MKFKRDEATNGDIMMGSYPTIENSLGGGLKPTKIPRNIVPQRDDGVNFLRNSGTHLLEL
jgi:hypothetical protein